MAAETVVIDEFAGGVPNATLEFTDRLWDGSLAVELPRGSTVTRAEMVIEGVPRRVPGNRVLDFTNLTTSSHLWAREAIGVNIYPPRVDPYDNQWSPAALADLRSLAAVDGDRWHTETDDNCRPPYEWPVQLYHFNPVVPGATSIEVIWQGYGYNMVNTTTNLHAEMWLFNHSSSRWQMVDSYTGGPLGDHTFRYTVTPPSPLFALNGSIDVAITGMHSDEQNVGPVILTDQGHLYTDYVAVNATSPGGLQYPGNVTLAIGGHGATPITGPLVGEVVLGDDHGLRSALQSAIDDEVVSPGNLSLAMNISVGAITMGFLEVRGLIIEYEPPTNLPPEWHGPDGVEVLEDSDWTAVVDLDTSFTDDHNQGRLALEVATISDEANLSARVGTDPRGNRTLEVLPARDFFGEVLVSLTAVDLFGEVALSPGIVVDVLQMPDRPRIPDPGESEIDEGSPWSFRVPVEDPDLPDDTFLFSIEDGPEGLSIDSGTGVIEWTPGDDQVGRHSLNVTVVDRFGLERSRSLSVLVRNINDGPVITSSLELAAVQDVPVSYAITANDPDLPFGDVLRFEANSEVIEVTVVQAVGLIYLFPANEHVPGFEVVIAATDLLGARAEAVLTVSVENVNDPPRLAMTDPLEFHQGDGVSVRLVATDPDLGLVLPVRERLTFETEGPLDLHADGDGWINLTPGQALVGEHEVEYTVVDHGGLEDSVRVTWTILDVNDPPVIETRLDPVVYAHEDAEFTLALEATDPDGDPLRWSDDSDLFDIDPVTGVVVFTPLQEDVGRRVVLITVSDGRGGEAMLTLDLEVLGMNDPPVIHTILPENGTRFREGETVTFVANVSDEDDHLLVTCIWREGSSELGRGTVLDHRGLPPGKHTITLTVTDSEHSVEGTVTVVVEASEGMGTAALMMIALLIVLVVLALLLLLRQRRGQVPE